MSVIMECNFRWSVGSFPITMSDWYNYEACFMRKGLLELLLVKSFPQFFIRVFPKDRICSSLSGLNFFRLSSCKSMMNRSDNPITRPWVLLMSKNYQIFNMTCLVRWLPALCIVCSSSTWFVHVISWVVIFVIPFTIFESGSQIPCYLMIRQIQSDSIRSCLPLDNFCQPVSYMLWVCRSWGPDISCRQLDISGLWREGKVVWDSLLQSRWQTEMRSRNCGAEICREQSSSLLKHVDCPELKSNDDGKSSVNYNA